MKIKYVCFWLMMAFFLLGITATASEIFVEAEDFQISGTGWRKVEGGQARLASMVASLWGATGPVDSTASTTLAVTEEGAYRLWVRYLQRQDYSGPFTVALFRGNEKLAEKHFDLKPKNTVNNDYVWDYFDLPLAVGGVEIRLGKYNEENSYNYTRHVDCMLLTTNKSSTAPDHMNYGPQTYMRVTLADIYERPLYIHIFADHYRAPWYVHYAISKNGIETRTSPSGGSAALLKGGERTEWINITPMLYQDSGARLEIRTAYSYNESTPRFKGTIELASAPSEDAIVRVIERDSEPSYMHIVMPPNLSTAENLALCMTEQDYADVAGEIADNMQWPSIGKNPQDFPFFITANINPLKTDAKVYAREFKTLVNFGYNGFARSEGEYIKEYGFDKLKISGELWTLRDNSNYLMPREAEMRTKAQKAADTFRANGASSDDIVYCMLMDEPPGAPLNHLVGQKEPTEKFRVWLQEQGKGLAELLPGIEGDLSWEQVRPVNDTERDKYPALHYFTQKFRTYALGNFMELQSGILQEAYGAKIPMVANFSDGAVYYANFYGQGVDYFELMETTGQNAICSEDWANGASTYQFGAYNIDLMRAAARRSGSSVHNLLIAYSGRKPWDVKLKGMSAVGRGVDSLTNFYYGPSWNGHEKGWFNNPSNWYDNAELVREIGGAEDLLTSAKPIKAEIAILYSSSTDIWTLKHNYAYGFDRMHNWLALTHAQIPVDIISEYDLEAGLLDEYRVCYFSGPNLTRKAAQKLQEWVNAGGTLIVTAGAGSKDEYNQPLATLDNILPVQRASLEELQRFLSSGKYLDTLTTRDRVAVNGATLDVLSVRQKMSAGSDAEVLGRFQDGTPAIVRGQAGKGTVYSFGFLPSLSYIKPALVARKQLEQNVGDIGVVYSKERVSEEQLIGRSQNPWQYPAEIRDVIILPVQDPCIKRPLSSSEALVDAMYMKSTDGVVIPLSNYTLQPISEVDFTVRVERDVARVESVHQGELSFRKINSQIEFSLPLVDTDIIKIYYQK